MPTSPSVLESLHRLEDRLTPRRVFLGLVVLVVAMKWPVLHQPPVWDGAQSVFPAAITLARLGFDLPELLEQPGYMYGGPNVHGLSVVTWATALAYWLFGERPAVVLPVLHTAHFVLAAWTLTSLWRLGVHLMPEVLKRCWALGGVLCFAVCPLFFVQAGTLYLELPILAFTSAAIADWVEGRTLRTGLWATLAALVKPPGMIVAGALAASALLTAGSWTERLRTAAVVLVGPLTFAGIFAVLRPHPTGSFATLEAQLYYAKSIPDIVAILGLFVVSSLLLRTWRTTNSRAARAARASLMMFASFAAFYSLLAIANTSVNVLPRYYLQLVPFALLGLLAMLATRRPPVAIAATLLLTLFFLANRRGHFYPESGSARFAVTERSMAYLELAELQDEGLRRLIELAKTDPVFYSLYEHYKLSYPAMGYHFEVPRDRFESGRWNGHCIFFEPRFRAGHLQAFPPKFHMLYDAPWLGGEVMMKVAYQADKDPNWRTRSTHLRVGRFRSQLMHVRRVETDPAL